MNIFSRVKQALFSRIVEASLPMGVMDMLKRWGKDPDVSQDALVRRYWGWTYACAQLSASRFATTPLRLYARRAVGESPVSNFSTVNVTKSEARLIRQRFKSNPAVSDAEDYEELTEHPLLDLLTNINDQENSYEAKELTCTMLDLTGDAYWMLERSELGLPTKLFVLRSQWVKILPDQKKFVLGYRYGCDGIGQVDLKPSEVVHFKYPNPLDPWYGMGPVQAASYAIESQEMREKFIIATMGNMARPDLIVKYVDGELEAKDRRLVEREWNNSFRGPAKAGKVKVTDHRFEIDKLGWTPQELRFNEGEEWVMKKICGAFPVPVGLVDTSLISRALRAGMEGGELFMAQFNTLPRCLRVEQKLNEKLCPMYDDRLFMMFDNPVPRDKQFELTDDNVRLGNGSVTINEVRARDGKDPVPWGDEPMAMQAVGGMDSFNPLGDSLSSGTTGATPYVRPLGLARGARSPGGPISDKSAGMTMEVEGQYVHPSLEGIPIRLLPGSGMGKHSPDAVDRIWARADDEGSGSLRRVFAE